MPTYFLKISDGFEVETSIDVPAAHEAVNAALNAMSQFACKRFPPPDTVQITVTDSNRKQVAVLRMDFSITYGDGVMN